MAAPPPVLGDDERATAEAEELLRAMESYNPIVRSPAATSPHLLLSLTGAVRVFCAAA